MNVATAKSVLLAVLLALAASAPAGAQDRSRRPVSSEAIVYYLDGSGGGGLFISWAGRVRRGLEQGGFRGEFRNYDWQTGLGPLLDHAMRESSKRDRGRKLAAEIRQELDSRRDRCIHLIGLSAGTAILVHTLEALPAGYQVDNVVLFGSSIRSDYDLTGALRGVGGRMYVFSSPHDRVLKSLVPAVGTADRSYTATSVAGLRGFSVPRGAEPETRRLYARITHVPYRPGFARYGHSGSHTGATNRAFVRRYVAPLLLGNRPATRPSGWASRRQRR